MGKNEEQIIEPQDETPVDAEATTVSEEVDEALAEALAKVDEFKEALQRERADFQNFRKRTEREKETLKTSAAGKLLEKFLPIIDDFDRALGAIPEEESGNDWLKGITLIQRKFRSVLEAEGVKEIDPLGEEFDPNFHEAIGADEPTDDYESGQITAVLQKGYMLDDRVLRPAMVRVAS
jgi:molecular chaperone GrpE